MAIKVGARVQICKRGEKLGLLLCRWNNQLGEEVPCLCMPYTTRVILF